MLLLRDEVVVARADVVGILLEVRMRLPLVAIANVVSPE